jgi:hypothetical protein
MADPWLTPAEVTELTARKRWSAQCRALKRMGVKFTPNGAGRPLVPRDAVLGSAGTRQPRKAAPDWSAIDGTQAKA